MKNNIPHKKMSQNNKDNSASLLAFPDGEEQAARQNLERLFGRWQAHMRENLPSNQKRLAKGFVWDGFYPCYFRQQVRILFIGREARGLEECDYLDVMLPAYKLAKRIGQERRSKHLNAAFFHARMFHIAWGIQHGLVEWDDIPWAAELADTFATPQGMSFAFMNISKLSNEQGTWPAQWKQIRMAVEASGDFIQEEIALLKPHIVVSMNLGELLGSLGDRSDECREPCVERYRLSSKGHRSLLINTWHFAAPGKSHVRDFYSPICEAIRNSIADESLDAREVANRQVDWSHLT